MQYPQPPSNLRSLRDRLSNIAKDQKVVVSRLQQHVAVLIVAEFFQLIEDNLNVPSLLIKGGTSLEMRCGINASRTSRDLDVVTNQDINVVYEKLSLKVQEGWNEFSGVLTAPALIDVPGLIVKPQRFKVKLQFKNKPFSTVPVEIAPKEAGNADSFDIAKSNALSLLGFNLTSEVPCMSIAWQLAQKFHACSDENLSDRPNNRAHDLVDLIILETLVVEEMLTSINSACEAVFSNRARQAWPVSVTDYPHWNSIYKQSLEGLEDLKLPSTSELAVQRVNEFIQRIWSSS